MIETRLAVAVSSRLRPYYSADPLNAVFYQNPKASGRSVIIAC
jgi:hypothetical protein